MVSNNFEQIWKQFEEHHCLVSTPKTFGNGFHGAAAVNVTVEPGTERTLTLVLGWFYPNRDFTGMLYINNYSPALCLKRTIRKKL